MEQQWIADRLAELGKKKAELAQALELPPTRISEILRGRRDIHICEILPMARCLEMDPMTVLLMSVPVPPHLQPDELPPMAQALQIPREALTPDEREMVAAFRNLGKQDRRRWIATTVAYASSK
jgi:hypothetical protein